MSAELVFEIVRHAGECVTPFLAQLVADVFIASGERNRLERDRLHFVDVLRSKLDDLTDAIVVDAVDDGHDERDFDPDFSQVLDRTQLNVEQVANTAVFVLLFTHTVELKINTVLSRCFRGSAKLDVLSETNSISRREDAIEADLLRVSDCVEVVRRKRRLTAREENDHLSSWFE